MSVLEAILLGILQGLTEFLPVSSSGHLALGQYLVNNLANPEDNLLFTVFVHGATSLSTIVVFRKDILKLLQGLLAFKWNVETKYVSWIAISMIPVSILGLFFKEEVEAVFEGKLWLIGSMLICTGLLLLFTHHYKPKEGKMNGKNALAVGFSQMIAVMPGISRSGATISTALLLGVDRTQAARFSFLMVLPPILGATLLETKDLMEAPAGAFAGQYKALIWGALAAFIAGVLACRWMIRIVQKSRLSFFAYYCFAIGAMAIVAAFVL